MASNGRATKKTPASGRIHHSPVMRGKGKSGVRFSTHGDGSQDVYKTSFGHSHTMKNPQNTGNTYSKTKSGAKNQ